MKAKYVALTQMLYPHRQSRCSIKEYKGENEILNQIIHFWFYF